jgi:hypothetical protein
MDGFDHYAVGQINAKWTNASGVNALSGPGRIGYGQFAALNGVNVTLTRGISPITTVIVGFAMYYNQSTFATQPIFTFQDSGANTLATITVTASGGLAGPGGASSASGILSANTWCYIECQVVLSATSTGSCTLRLNGSTVATVASVVTAASSNPCALLGFTSGTSGSGSAAIDVDDFYVLNATAPNNTFLGDIKIYPIYPSGNGRISGFSRFGGTSSGNYTAVNENPPDGDVSYVYTATAGTEDAYTLSALSNVATVKAVQICGYVRKDDTPSHVVALGVGNGTTESFGSGTAVNTTYSYILQPFDQNPLTSAAWAVTDFTTLQGAVKLVS